MLCHLIILNIIHNIIFSINYTQVQKVSNLGMPIHKELKPCTMSVLKIKDRTTKKTDSHDYGELYLKARSFNVIMILLSRSALLYFSIRCICQRHGHPVTDYTKSYAKSPVHLQYSYRNARYRP